MWEKLIYLAYFINMPARSLWTSRAPQRQTQSGAGNTRSQTQKPRGALRVAGAG